MHDEPDFIAFPDLPDEAVIALNDLLEEFYTRFQNHYFAQMHRYYHDRSTPDPLRQSDAAAARRPAVLILLNPRGAAVTMSRSLTPLVHHRS